MELRRGLAEDLYLCLEVWLGLGCSLVDLHFQVH